MPMKFLSSFLFLITTLTACSIYQSDGRKFLEKRAYEYSGASAYERLQGCAPSTDVHSEELVLQTEAASAFKVQNPSVLRVVTNQAAAIQCDYGFTEGEDLKTLAPEAIELTLKLHL